MQTVTAKFEDVKVLVVEDYVINQQTTKGLLELMNCEVDIAESGEDALEKIKNENYDLIIMDIQMPDMDGYEATQKIRDNEGNKKHTPIIALTANVMEGDQEKCIEAGMDDYLSKPIRGAELERMLLKYLTEQAVEGTN